jgi:hypothetical protein
VAIESEYITEYVSICASADLVITSPPKLVVLVPNLGLTVISVLILARCSGSMMHPNFFKE